MSRLRHLGWTQCSHGLSSRPLESCHHRCLTAVCEVLEYPKGSALELLDGTLKLRHCTDLFTMRFPPWSLPRVGNSGEKRRFITTGLPETGNDLGKRVRLTRKTRSRVRWASLAVFFLDLGLGEFCTRGPFGGNRRRVFAGWSGSRRSWCAGTSPCNSLHACVRITRDTHVNSRSAPPPPLTHPTPHTPHPTHHTHQHPTRLPPHHHQPFSRKSAHFSFVSPVSR